MAAPKDDPALSPEELSSALTRADADQYARDPAEYRRQRRGRAGTGGREVDAWWPHIAQALKDGHTQKRIWEYLHQLESPGELPRLTIRYRQFNQLVSKRWREQQTPLAKIPHPAPPATRSAEAGGLPFVDVEDGDASPYLPAPAQLTESPPRGDYGRVTKADAKKLIG